MIVDRLQAAQDALAAALEGGEVGAVIACNVEMAQALAEAQAIGGWRDRSHLRAAIVTLLASAERMAGRVNMLADDNRRRLDRLATATGAPRTQSYGRSGRLG